MRGKPTENASQELLTKWSMSVIVLANSLQSSFRLEGLVDEGYTCEGKTCIIDIIFISTCVMKEKFHRTEWSAVVAQDDCSPVALSLNSCVTPSYSCRNA